MPFAITAIHEKQKPIDGAPFQEDDGDWTYFDCKADEDANVKFTVGVKSKQASGDLPFAWGEADLYLVGWKTTDAGVQAFVVTNRWQFEDEESELYLADPATGALEHQKDADARYDLDNLLSPDGKHRVRVGENDLVVTDVGTGEQRQFVFHEDDLEFVGEECIEWVSPRYLKFNGQRLAFIDVATMKMCFPQSAEETHAASHTYKFSPELRWVLFEEEDAEGPGLYLAPVELP